jgi:hypothetical protein
MCQKALVIWQEDWQAEHQIDKEHGSNEKFVTIRKKLCFDQNTVSIGIGL